MNTELARSLVAQRQDELASHASQAHRAAGAAAARRWHLNWTRETLAPSGTTGRAGRSWVIISATIRGV
jgi:hypothetical protein